MVDVHAYSGLHAGPTLGGVMRSQRVVSAGAPTSAAVYCVSRASASLQARGPVSRRACTHDPWVAQSFAAARCL